jgi:hypothetical protein
LTDFHPVETAARSGDSSWSIFPGLNISYRILAPLTNSFSSVYLARAMPGLDIIV